MTIFRLVRFVPSEADIEVNNVKQLFISVEVKDTTYKEQKAKAIFLRNQT